ncbi:hypothetical protein MT418_000563 [Batrachochytrium dendrobatidis]
MNYVKNTQYIMYILIVYYFLPHILVGSIRITAQIRNITGGSDVVQNMGRAFTPNNISEFQLTGGYHSCYYVSMNISGVQLSISVDSGSTDLAVAGVGLNNYSSSTGGVTFVMPNNAPSVSGFYADGSWWKGFGLQSTVSLSNSHITASNAPFSVITSQSTNPIFVKGTGNPNQNGLLGVAYHPLSQLSFSPPTVMDAWYAQGSIKNNEIAFHACPYSQMADAYIDFGNDSPSYDCNPSGLPIAWALCPSKSYFTMDIRNISVSNQQVILPSNFQTTDPSLIGGKYKAWSFIDSCSSLIHVPAVVNTALKNAIISSGALSNQLSSTVVNNLLSGTYAYSITPYINWTALPTLSFDIVSDQTDGTLSKVFTVTLSGQQYLQCDQNAYCTYLVGTGSDAYATLGIPVFSNLHITLDRTNGRVGFAPGCGCSTSANSYPNVYFSNTTIVRTWDPNSPFPNAARPRLNKPNLVMLLVALIHLGFWIL